MRGLVKWSSKWWPGAIPLAVLWALAAWTSTLPLEVELAGRSTTALKDILLDKSRIHAVHLGGKRMALPDRTWDPREVTDRALVNWTDVYTQARVAELRRAKPLPRAAE